MATQTFTIDPGAAATMEAMGAALARLTAVARQLQGITALRSSLTALDRTARAASVSIDRTVTAALGGFTELEAKANSLRSAIRSIGSPASGSARPQAPAKQPEPPAWPIPKDLDSVSKYVGLASDLSSLRDVFGKRGGGGCCCGGSGSPGRREGPSRTRELLTSARERTMRAARSVGRSAGGVAARLAGTAGGAVRMAGGLLDGAAGVGGRMLRGGGSLLGTVGKGLKMLTPVGLGIAAGGMASGMIADSMAARGVEMPEPGGFASGAGAVTGFDPRLIQMGIDFLGTVPGLLSQAWSAIAAVVSPWGEAFTLFMSNIATGAQNVWNGLAQFFTVTIPGMFTQGVESIKGVFGTLAAFFTDTVPAAFTALGQRMTELKDRLIGLAGEAVGKVQGFFGNLGAFFTETLPAKFQQLLATFGELRTQLVGLAGQLVNEFVARVQGIGTFFLETLPRMLRSGARGIINALIDGLIAAARSLPGVGAMVAQKLADYLHGNSPPPRGPLSDIIRGGYNVMVAWTEGLASAGGPVRSAAAWLGGTVAGVLGLSARSSAGAVLPGVQPNPALAATAPPTATGTAPGGASGGPGLLGQVGNMLGQKFGGLISSLGPLGMVATLLEGVFQGLAPLVDALKEPLRIVGEIFGKGMAPILKALFPVFKLVAIAATYIGQIFFIVAGGIARAIGSVIKALGTAIDKIPFLGDFGLKKFGQGIIDTGKGFEQSARDLADGREEIKKLKFGETAEAAKETAENLRNVPDGFKIALARFNAAAPATVAGPTGVSTATVPVHAPGSVVPVQGGPVTIEQVHIVSDNPETIWHRLRDVMERENLRRSGSPMAFEMAL